MIRKRSPYNTYTKEFKSEVRNGEGQFFTL
jgi:hypothetical protein